MGTNGTPPLGFLARLAWCAGLASVGCVTAPSSYVLEDTGRGDLGNELSNDSVIEPEVFEDREVPDGTSIDTGWDAGEADTLAADTLVAVDTGRDSGQPDTLVAVDTGRDSGQPDTLVAVDTGRDSGQPDTLVAVDTGRPDTPADLNGCALPTMLCGNTCTDVRTDLRNCGACGRACSVACRAGVCVTVTEVVAGGGDNSASISCALFSDGTVSCWGADSAGQLGDGASVPSRSRPVAVLGLTGVVQLALGDAFACARTMSGGVWCWGSNAYSQLGRVSPDSRPAQVVLPEVDDFAVDLSAGGGHVCMVSSARNVRCWGRNIFGECGTEPGDSSTTVRTPTLVTGFATPTQFAEVSTGVVHTCALARDGSVYCWGMGTGGELGDGMRRTQATPTRVLSMLPAVQVESGGEDSCARLGNGTVSCWGNNRHGAGGNGSTNLSSQPVAVTGLTDANALSVGSYFSCALSPTAGALCWGYNAHGELGDGTMTNRTLRTPVSLAGVTRISAGYAHACAVTGAGAWCWGRNAHGELGDGTTTDQPRPTRVVF